MSLLKKLAGETALYGLSSIVGRFINFLLFPLYTYYYTKAEFGVISKFYAYTGFLMVLYSYRMESAFFRFGTPEQDRERTYGTGMLSLWATTLLFTALLFLFAQPVANFLHFPGHPEYVRWFALILALDCLCELPFARLRLEQRPRRFVAIRLANIGVNVCFNVFWLVFCPWAARHGWQWVHAVWSPQMGVGYVFLSNVIASAASFLLLMPQIATASLRFDAALWKKMAVYSLPLVVVGFAGIINEMLDRAVMDRLLSGSQQYRDEQIGIYSANYKLAMLITLFTQAYRYAAEPFFFRQAGSQNEYETQASAAKWFFIAGTTGMLGILLFIDAAKYVIAQPFHSGLKIVPILLAANLFLGLYYNFSIWYRLKDKTVLGAWIAVGGASLTLLLNIWWVPIWGYMGAAWATLACYIFMSGATWLTGRRYYPVRYPLGQMALYFFIAFSLAGFSLFLKKQSFSPWIQWPANVILFLIFVALIWFREIKPNQSPRTARL